MNDHLIMLIVFGIFASLIAVGRVKGVLAKPDDQEQSEYSKDVSDPTRPFYCGIGGRLAAGDDD